MKVQDVIIAGLTCLRENHMNHADGIQIEDIGVITHSLLHDLKSLVADLQDMKTDMVEVKADLSRLRDCLDNSYEPNCMLDEYSKMNSY